MPAAIASQRPDMMCANCRYSHVRNLTFAAAVECRKVAPVVVAGRDWAVYPLLSPDSWCGQHEYEDKDVRVVARVVMGGGQ